ncbi:MAG: multidrug ABC transporter ATP-binding protein, partial [Marivirga sp.]|nr:multidrug ABC transporter ATP-binding protein [Marivirga sp.]
MAKRKGREELREEEKRPINKKTLKHLLGIFRFILPYKGWFIVGLASLGLSSVTLLAFPYLAGKLLDVAGGKTVPYFSNINQIALALLGILFVQGAFS